MCVSLCIYRPYNKLGIHTLAHVNYLHKCKNYETMVPWVEGGEGEMEMYTIISQIKIGVNNFQQ